MAALVWRLIGALYILFMISPLVLVGLFSFTDGGMANFPIHALTLKWWEAMLANPAFTSALTNSLIIGLVVSVISAVLGTMAAMGLSQLPPAVANSVMLVLSTPLMLPPLVLGVALLSFYVAAGIRLGLVTVIMSQLLFTLPFVILVIVARLRSFDFRIVESARDLGASQLTAFRTVTLPVIQPSIIGAALISLALSLDDFIVTFFTIGSGNTLPTFVWGMIRTSLTPTANAIGTLILILTLTSTIVALRLTRYRG
jgi:spermidine/putrescine transport system permease protein